MNTYFLRRAREAYPYHDMAEPSTTRGYRRQWVRAVRRLGSAWLMHPANAQTRARAKASQHALAEAAR